MGIDENIEAKYSIRTEDGSFIMCSEVKVYSLELGFVDIEDAINETCEFKWMAYREVGAISESGPDGLTIASCHGSVMEIMADLRSQIENEKLDEETTSRAPSGKRRSL